MGILLSMQGAVAQGVLWGIMTLGVYISRIVAMSFCEPRS